MFYIVAALFYIPAFNAEGVLISPYSCQHLFFISIIVTILMDMKLERVAEHSGLQDYHPSPALFQMPVKSPNCHLYLPLIDYRLVVPTTPSLGLINLLGKLMELRETF